MKLSYRNAKNAEVISRFWGKSLEKPDWYKAQSLSDSEEEIMIYDVIGWPYNDATDLVRHISNLKGKDLTVRMNTPGGDVFDGMAIYNALASHSGKVTVKIESLAASMGSVIAMAGNEVQAYGNAMMMIHEPWTFAMGNQYELTDIADLLSKMSSNMIDIYSQTSKVGKREVKQMMKDTTWMTAKEAKDKGFIDTILESGQGAKAQFDLSMFANVPDGITGNERESTEREKERALRDVGFSQKEAKAILAGRCKAGAIDELAERARNLIKKIGGK